MTGPPDSRTSRDGDTPPAVPAADAPGPPRPHDTEPNRRANPATTRDLTQRPAEQRPAPTRPDPARPLRADDGPSDSAHHDGDPTGDAWATDGGDDLLSQLSAALAAAERWVGSGAVARSSDDEADRPSRISPEPPRGPEPSTTASPAAGTDDAGAPDQLPWPEWQDLVPLPGAVEPPPTLTIGTIHVEVVPPPEPERRRPRPPRPTPAEPPRATPIPERAASDPRPFGWRQR